MSEPRYVRPGRYVRKTGAGPSQLVWILLGAFLLAALVTVYLTFVFVKALTSSRQPEPLATPLIQPANVPAANATLDPNLLTTPLQAGSGPTAQAWDGTSRVNILMMGLDYRDWEDGDGPSRTDTMILFTIDPTTRSVGMLSIPRDLWVNIPGFDYNKINTAYFLGDAYDTPGGGPGLAMETVENLLDIQIHYYAQVDFSAFEAFIDEIGGIDINVPEEISVDPIGPHNTVTLEAGLNTLDGEVALAYARSRNSPSGDFDRAQRQQQVIMAIRKKIMDFNMVPLLIEKSPILYQQLASGVHTNLTLEQVISLAWLAQQIPEQNIHRAAIGYDQVIMDFSWDGQSILLPIPEQILAVKDQVFSVQPGGSAPAVPVAPVAPTLVVNPEELRAAEAARIAVYNGTQTAGLAARTMHYLTEQGLDVVVADNARETYERTTIIDYTGSIYTQQYLMELLNVQGSQVFSRYDPNSEIDIAVYLGDDWAANNSMP